MRYSYEQFPPKTTFRHFAKEAYRLALMTGKVESHWHIGNALHTVTVDFELGCVFFSWVMVHEGERYEKAASVTIAKSWA